MKLCSWAVSMAPGPDTDRGYVYPVWEESFKQSAALDNRSLYLKNCKTCETLRSWRCTFRKLPAKFTKRKLWFLKFGCVTFFFFYRKKYHNYRETTSIPVVGFSPCTSSLKCTLCQMSALQSTVRHTLSSRSIRFTEKPNYISRWNICNPIF